MKVKTSMKMVKRFNKVWSCGYCDLQKIFSSYDYQFYNAGVYGWNCDIYIDPIRNQVITTGYRNMRGERIPSELLEKYNRLSDRNVEEYRETGNHQAYNENIEFIKEEFLKELANI